VQFKGKRAGAEEIYKVGVVCVDAGGVTCGPQGTTQRLYSTLKETVFCWRKVVDEGRGGLSARGDGEERWPQCIGETHSPSQATLLFL